MVAVLLPVLVITILYYYDASVIVSLAEHFLGPIWRNMRFLLRCNNQEKLHQETNHHQQQQNQQKHVDEIKLQQFLQSKSSSKVLKITSTSRWSRQVAFLGCETPEKACFILSKINCGICTCQTITTTTTTVEQQQQEEEEESSFKNRKIIRQNKIS